MAYPTAESLEIAAPAETVWAMVSDLPRMGQWSPENEGGRWLKGATGPVPGAMFKGKNKNGIRRWSTTVKVVDCQPGRAFEISVSTMGMAIANWRYDIQETAEGCLVTESWDDHRTGLMKLISAPMGDHSGEHAKTEMAATLANIARAAEN
jgi:polyketide cyclase/dehydrase/lipid transport protein